MLAARDQENLVHGHQQAAASKPLNQNTRALPPKTPGNKYPKTPLKINLHDENDPVGYGGAKSALATKGKGLENFVTGGKKVAAFDKNVFITPMGPRSRAPLGMKTTNAKAKAFQTPAEPAIDKDLQKTQIKPSSARRPKPKISHAETVKLDIHGDNSGPLEEREVEYCPPKPKNLPYESEDFPDGCLDYEILKPANMMRGWQSYYLNPTDENGVSLREKEFEAKMAKALKDTDERVLQALEELDWTVGDVPETFVHQREIRQDKTLKVKTDEPTGKRSALVSRGPATVTSRKAASALSMVPKENLTAPKRPMIATAAKTPVPLLARGKKVAIPVQANTSAIRHTVATAASRSTIGYTKGRSASNVLHMHTGGLSRAASNMSNASNATITPVTYLQNQNSNIGREDWSRLQLLGAFDTDDEDLEPGLRGMVPDCLKRGDDAEEEFVLTLSGV